MSPLELLTMSYNSLRRKIRRKKRNNSANQGAGKKNDKEEYRPTIEVFYKNINYLLTNNPYFLIPEQAEGREEMIGEARDLMNKKYPVLEDYLLNIDNNYEKTKPENPAKTVLDYIKSFIPKESSDEHYELRYSLLKALNVLSKTDEFIKNPYETINYLKENDSKMPYTSLISNNYESGISNNYESGIKRV